ncbi:MAG: DUF421 domain-containing protein [Clostridia bacterium]|nr:DUF421 domain-containing protein [Clostridia bacterium]
MLIIVIHTIIIYFTLILAMRIMGKRQLGELQASEFIIAVMLSEIATTPITSPDFPLLHAIVPIAVLITLEILISALLIRSNALKRLFYGKPAILINRGTLDITAMKKNRIELDELLSELRQKGFSDVSHINYAILEENGKLSVFPKVEKAPLTPEDMQITTHDDGIAHLLILDGTIIAHNLTAAGWSRKRLDSELKKRHTDPEDVFLLTADDGGHVTFILKERK